METGFLAVALVFGIGCIGGWGSSMEAGERHKACLTDETVIVGLLALYYRNTKCQTLFLSQRGHVLAGGFAALVVWAIKGPLAEVTIVPYQTGGFDFSRLAVEEVGIALAAGFGGPYFVLLIAAHLCGLRQNEKNKG